MLPFFKQVNQIIESGQLSQLSQLSPEKPEFFNWVEDIFYPMHVQAYGDGPALIWSYQEQEKIYTFQEMFQLGNQLVNLLRRHGLGKGHTICSMLPLIPENWISFMATIKGGYILTPTATNLVADDLMYRFQTLLPDIIIAHLDFTEAIDSAEKAIDKIIPLKIVVGGQKEGWVNFEEIFNEPPTCEAAPTRSDDPFLFFFTSGTTGLPKIVVHTHYTYPVGHLSTLTWLGCRRGDVHYNISSPGWAKFAWSSFFAPWNAGATILAKQVDQFDAQDQLATMEKREVNTFCGSPTVIRMLIQEDMAQYRLKLRSCCAAGEPLNPDVIDKWKKATGLSIRDGYGQTETTALIVNLPGEPLKPGSMGKPTFLYDVGIYNEDGQELPPMEEGVICIKLNPKKNSGLFLQYLADEERTAEVFQHQLYYTGDKAYQDEEGYIWFVGRNDDVIKASAYRIGPFEVESVLIEHEAIVEAAVVASPHPVRGFAVKAFVMLKPGVEPSAALAEAIFTFSEQKLSKYKVPRILEFPGSLPKTISGKIRRVELRAQEASSKLNKETRKHEYFHQTY